MSVAHPIPPMQQTPNDQEPWPLKPVGWRALLSDRLLWLAVGVSFLVHLIVLAPQYGIKLPQRGDKSVLVSFHSLNQSAARHAAQSAVQPRKTDRPQDARTRVTKPPPGTTAPSVKAAPSRDDLAPMNSLAGNPIAGGRRVSLTPGMKDYRYSQYLEDWRLKVERIGAMNYPEEARGKFFGTLVMSVALRPNGSVDRMIVLRSSGNKVLDDAAKRIVTIAAPFAPFPPDIRKETDYLDITRTWSFTRGNAVETR